MSLFITNSNSDKWSHTCSAVYKFIFIANCTTILRNLKSKTHNTEQYRTRMFGSQKSGMSDWFGIEETHTLCLVGNIMIINSHLRPITHGFRNLRKGWVWLIRTSKVLKNNISTKSATQNNLIHLIRNNIKLYTISYWWDSPSSNKVLSNLKH